jgi:DnaA family protein
VKQLALGVRLRAEAVFASFWPGPNAELVAALQAPAPSAAPDSPAAAAALWIWGARGSGKTHLLQAVCAGAADAAAYFPLARSVALPPEALAGFERSRVLCIDDVDAVAADPAWEAALFRLFNAAAELRTRLIFAAAAPPRRPGWLLEDWRSRAASCVVYQLRELDDAGRIEALQLHAVQRGLQLPYEAADYLVKRMPRDSHSLFDILDRLDEASWVAQRRLTIPFIRDALEKHAGTKS